VSDKQLPAKIFLSLFLSFCFALKARFQVRKFEFCQVISWSRTTEKLAINW